MIITTVFTVHYSPFTIDGNSQVTLMEYNNLGWNFKNQEKNKYHDFRVNGINIIRYRDAIYGTMSNFSFRYSQKLIPDEFGYDTNNYLCDYYNIKDFQKKINMILTKYGMIHYKIYFPEIWNKTRSYSDLSMKKLYSDQSVSKIFHNGETSLWVIKKVDL